MEIFTPTTSKLLEGRRIFAFNKCQKVKVVSPL